MIKPVILLLLMVLALPCASFAEIYEWNEGNGSFGYTNDLRKVPEKYRDTVVVKEYQTTGPGAGDGSGPEQTLHYDAEPPNEDPDLRAYQEKVRSVRHRKKLRGPGVGYGAGSEEED